MLRNGSCLDLRQSSKRSVASGMNETLWEITPPSQAGKFFKTHGYYYLFWASHRLICASPLYDSTSVIIASVYYHGEPQLLKLKLFIFTYNAYLHRWCYRKHRGIGMFLVQHPIPCLSLNNNYHACMSFPRIIINPPHLPSIRHFPIKKPDIHRAIPCNDLLTRAGVATLKTPE